MNSTTNYILPSAFSDFLSLTDDAVRNYSARLFSKKSYYLTYVRQELYGSFLESLHGEKYYI